MPGPMDELAAIRELLADLPERLAAVLRRDAPQRDAAGRFVGQGGGDSGASRAPKPEWAARMGARPPVGSFGQLMFIVQRLQDMYSHRPAADARWTHAGRPPTPAVPPPSGAGPGPQPPADARWMKYPSPAEGPKPAAPDWVNTLGPPPVGSPAAQKDAPKAPPPRSGPQPLSDLDYERLRQLEFKENTPEGLPAGLAAELRQLRSRPLEGPRPAAPAGGGTGGESAGGASTAPLEKAAEKLATVADKLDGLFDLMKKSGFGEGDDPDAAESGEIVGLKQRAEIEEQF